MNKKIGIMGILGLLVCIIAISGCTSNSNDSSINATFNNSFISFQYPKNLQVENNNESGATIITNNNAAGNGVQVIPEDKATYNENMAYDPTWKNEGIFKSDGGVSYRVATSKDINGNILEDYEFTKNGKYYEILGTASDLDVMDDLVDSVN